MKHQQAGLGAAAFRDAQTAETNAGLPTPRGLRSAFDRAL